MMENLLWRLGFLLLAAVFVWILHRYVGEYPPALHRETPSKNIPLALLLWGVALIFPVLMMFWITPWLDQAIPERIFNQLVQVPIRSIPFLILPIVLVTWPRGWSAKDVGLSKVIHSREAAIFAVMFGLGSGGIAYLTGRSNISIQALSLSELLILFYNNAFLEEFYHRGVIQTLLEQSWGQRTAVLGGGILFGLIHVALDVSALGEIGGILAVLSALMVQTLAGWLFSILYLKTRNLWPGIVCHYLANWLPSILLAVFG